ncbi:MAG: hypothetical protein CMM01_23735 [Rhodopirellula sp.]|nr:hypothetical protein [Rhodopirellula sp.]
MSSAVSYPSCVRRSRRRWAVAVCLPVFCVLQVNVTREARCEESRHQCPQQLADFDESQLELAFVKGIEFLISTQRYDGGWGGPQWTGGVDSDPVPGAFRSFDIAVTAMCLEALLADTKGGRSIEQARLRALRFLLDRTGTIKRAGPTDLPNVWAHCYCIQTFSRLHQLSASQAERSTLAAAIRMHMTGLERWQSIHGGWFYYGSGMSQPINPSCSFVNAAVLVALARAKKIGVEADGRMVTRAIEATKMMRKPDSSFMYTMRVPTDKARAMALINRPCGSLGRSQAGNVALRLWGDKHITDEVLKEWLGRLITRHGWLDMGRKRPIPHESHAAVAGYFYYFGMYYGGLCISQLPDDERQLYQQHLADRIIKRQEQDGSWFDYPLYSYHKPYGTAFALLTLEHCKQESSVLKQ